MTGRPEVSKALEPATDIAAMVEPGRTSMLAALRYRDFRLFWIGLLVSNVGTWMQMFGQGWLVVELAVRDGTPQLAPLYLGLVGLARAVPGLALGLVGGAVADRVDRRRMLLATQTAAGLLAALLATLTESGSITILAVILIGAASSAVFSFDAPTRQSMVPRLVAPRDLMSAIGLNSAAFNGPQIIGPAIGGLLIAPLGLAGLFYLNAISYGAVVIALLLMEPTPAIAAGARRSMLASVREGVRYMRADPIIRWVIVVVAATSFFARPYTFFLPAVAENILHVGAQELSWMLAVTGVGALAGALLVANLGEVRRRGALFVGFTAAMGAVLCLFAVQRSLPPALAMGLVVGLTQMAFVGLANTILQVSAPDHLRGRVMSVYTMVFQGIMPLGQFTLGALAALLDVDAVLFLGGAVTLASGAYLALRVPAIRGLAAATRAAGASAHRAVAE